MAVNKLADISTIPVRGGMNTAIEDVLIPYGGYSSIINFVPKRPGFEQRKGQKKHHSTADGSLEIIHHHQFSKGERTEIHLYRQLVDGSVQLATDNPPTVTTGVYGSDVLAAVASSIPSTGSVINDQFFYSDGVRQHQIFGGDQNPCRAFHVVKDTGAIPIMPTRNEDYTTEVTDGDSTTVASLDSLGDLAVDFDAVYIGFDLPINDINWTVVAVNGTASTSDINYWNGAWTNVSGYSDGTASGGAVLAQTGATTWTQPTDEVPHFMFGRNLFWYEFHLLTGDLDSDTTVSAVTGDSSAFLAIQNVWDGVLPNSIEVQVFDDADATYKTYSGSSITLNDFATADFLYFSSNHPVWAIFVDVGNSPNTNTATIDGLDYFNGTTFVTVSDIVDNTAGFIRSGNITWSRPSDEQALQLDQSKFFLYWYRISASAAFSDDVVVAILTMPYFDINKIGNLGNVNISWKERMVYSFNKFPSWIHISARGKPMTLNGLDYLAMEVGDGRNNKVLAAKNFYNELIVWQEEKGIDGGCTTLIEGNTTASFGKLLLSTSIGILNSKCAVVVDGVLVGEQSNQILRTIAFWISRKGVYMFDGIAVSRISNDIQNFFDSNDTTNVITNGQESKHWLSHSSVDQVLVMGLVTGSGGTIPNKFFQFDYIEALNASPGIFKGWSFREYAPALSSLTDIEAGSGDVKILQVAGGSSDGFSYQTNTGTDDVSTAVTSSFVQEFDGGGRKLQSVGEAHRVKRQSSGTFTREISIDGNSAFQDSVTFNMTAEATTTESYRRNTNENKELGHHLSYKFENANTGEIFYIEDVGVGFNAGDS